jgi:hypothetical protein
MRIRLTLIIAGLCLFLCGLIAIGYALWPLANVTLQRVLPSVLFAPP